MFIKSNCVKIREVYHLSRREDSTTDTEEAAIAAEPIQGCSTKPTGMNTPAHNSIQ